MDGFDSDWDRFYHYADRDDDYDRYYCSLYVTIEVPRRADMTPDELIDEVLDTLNEGEETPLEDYYGGDYIVTDDLIRIDLTAYHIEECDDCEEPDERADTYAEDWVSRATEYDAVVVDAWWSDPDD